MSATSSYCMSKLIYVIIKKRTKAVENINFLFTSTLLSAVLFTVCAICFNDISFLCVQQKGFSPLHVAAKYGKMEVASLLLQKRASPDAAGKVKNVLKSEKEARPGARHRP